MYCAAKTKAEVLSKVIKPYDKTRKLKGRSTVSVNYKDGTKAIRYHDTDVVTFLVDESVVLDSGGFRTVTTKDRINEYSPVKLYQVKGVWYINTDVERDVVFYDGITFDKEGNLVGNQIEFDHKKTNKVKRQIAKYIKLLDDMEEIPFPNSGDCWDCCMVNEDGKTMGDLSNSDHLEKHLKENYLHGSIIVNAMRERGYNDDQIGFHIRAKLLINIKNALRRYLMRRLLPELCSN